MIIGEAEYLGNFRQDSPEWHEARLAHIGSSDVASILGVGYKSAFTLWHEKAGLVEPSKPDARLKRKFAYGHHMEPFVSGLFSEAHPELHLQETGTWRHRDREWQGCNPDRLVSTDTDTDTLQPFACVELKTFPSLADWADGPPPGYRAQLLWQVDTFGFRKGWLAGYANLSGDFVEYEFELDPFEADAVRAKVLAFANSITLGEPPEIDGSEGTYQTLRRLNPSLTRGQEVLIEPGVAENYRAALRGFKEADADLNKWKGHLLAHMGTAQYAFHDGKKIASRVAVKDSVPFLKEA